MKKSSRWIRCTRIIAHSIIISPVIGVIIIGLACFVRFGALNYTGKTTMISTSTLMATMDIAELSTAEFRYRGIADIFADEDKTQVKCRVCYNAIVKAGINMKEVHFNVDNDSKVITATLPAIDLKVTIIDVQSMALLPSDADVELDIMLKSSKEDAEKEARESAELMSTAQENLKKTIEGILYALITTQGYTLNWN